ncbi:hypothetical protein [Pontixanthobacter luteolus]|uniref:hypothetical protein n=1 Tax=Pontixanthobacter luteolus TaxID=295089 RepID=UPI0023022517|nr:hypothetical protein [Pontixanthobacter luteolus]
MRISLPMLAAFALMSCSTGPMELSPSTTSAPHWGEKPRTRLVEANSVYSQQLPDARVHLPEGARYLGSTRFDLKDVVDAEIHLFVEANEEQVVERAYWIQFESYLPEYPNAAYDFMDDGMPLASLGDMGLFYRARFGRAEDVPPEGSEAQRVQQMIADAGYELPAETFSAQFHQVVSADNRSEILVIVIGDLAQLDLSFAQIVAGGRQGEPMKRLSEKALPVAQKTVRIQSPVRSAR